MRHSVSLGLRVLALTAVLFVFLGVAAQVTGVARSQPAATGDPAGAAGAGPEATALVATVLFCVLVAAVISWMIVRSALSGWRLVAAVFLAYYGLGTVMFQIESAVFLPRHLPAGFVPRLFAMGALVGLPFAPAAAWIHGRFASPAAGRTWVASPLPVRAWAVRLLCLAAAYVAVYFLAGYFIAFRNPQVVAYYDDIDAGSFVAGLARLWNRAPWIFALQALRGLMWVAFVIPFLVSFRGRSWELPLLIGCAYSVWVVMLLAPNPYMPQAVRMTHLVETGSSNFLFGCLVGLTWRRPAIR